MTAWLWRLLGAIVPLQTAFILGGFAIDGDLSAFVRVQVPLSCAVIVAGWLIVSGATLVGHARQFLRRESIGSRLSAVGLIAVGVAALIVVQVTATGFLVTAAVMLQLLAVLCLIDLLRSSSERRTWFFGGFIAMIMISVVWGVWQVAMGSSPASTILGVSARDAARLGESVVMVGGERVLRAYGLFPHPNIFAGYLVAAVAIVAGQYSQREVFRRVLSAVLVVGLLLTASRAGVLALLVFSVLSRVQQKHPLYFRRAFWASILFVFTLWVAALLLPDVVAALRGGGVLEARSIVERRAQIGEWWRVWLQNVWTVVFGVGFRGYMVALHEVFPGSPMWRYQPVHNAPLLLLAELGIAGCALLVYMLKKVTTGMLSPVGAAVFTLAMFDHYLVSLPAGLLLCGIFVAVLAGEKRVQ